jgi:hypothetical protein
VHLQLGRRISDDPFLLARRFCGFEFVEQLFDAVVISQQKGNRMVLRKQQTFKQELVSIRPPGRFRPAALSALCSRRT